jgi:hypothetical protein
MKAFKIIIISIIISGIASVASAQRIGDLKGINYQAVAVDDEGKEIVGMDINDKPLYNKQIGVKFSILKGNDGPVQYQETHAVLTDRYGLFSLTIGLGEQTGEGEYTKLLDMPWIDADQWLKVEISIKNDGNYKLVSLQQFMAVPYSFYTDDIADDAITTEKILDSTILNQDINTGAVDSRTILDRSIQSIDIAEGAVTTFEILDFTILNEDISTGAIDSRTILDRSIQSIDIAEGAVTTFEILDGTILNEDIANGTIDLTTKVTNILPVQNGGTGLDASGVTNGQVLIGNGTTGDFGLANLTPGTGIVITNTPGGIEISSGVTGVNSSSAGNVQIGAPGTGGCAGPGRQLATGTTWISPAIPLPGVTAGNIIVGTVNESLKGCMISTYVRTNNQIEVSIFNGTGATVCFNSNAELRVLVVQ